MQKLTPKFPLVVLFVAMLSFAFPPLAAQVSRGMVKEGLTIESAILGKAVRYTVYLPFDYERSERYYPVVYLLHGYSDNDMGWIQFGEAHLACDAAIANREIPPMILVMPDGGVSFYINNHDGSVRWEAFFHEEFMPAVEKKFRIRAEKRYRAIAGLSMGGYGALLHGLKYPDKFAGLAAFSAACRTPEGMAASPQPRWDRVYGPVFGVGLTGRDRLTDHALANNIHTIVEDAETEAFSRLDIWIDCGDDDFLTTDNAALHLLLEEKGIAHEYRVRDGAHRWSYWRTGLIPALQFLGTRFHQP